MSYLDSGDPDLHDDRRFSLEVALEWGRYPDKAQAREIRRLLTDRRYQEAFDLIEVASELPPKEDMYFLDMGNAAKLLGLDERAAYYHRRYEAGYDGVDPFFERLEEMVRSSCSVSEGMLEIIDLCAAARPHEDWQVFRTLEFEKDVHALADWLETILNREPAPATIDGFWFGLVNPVRDAKATSDMYVGGGEGAVDNPNAWAEKLTWTPMGDARSQVLDTIYTIAYGKGTEGLCNHAEHPLCLAFASLAVRGLATTLAPVGLLGDAPARVIQVGFDSGDFLRLGTVTPDGLTFPQDTMCS